jgi:L-ascorbate metabolism protein UlaG (beta-lactamase superfamily)
VAARTFGLARLAPPACKLDDLPPIDLVLISHAHFDHLDKPTLHHIVSDRTVVVTAERTRRLIPRGFAEVVELAWGDTFEHRGVRVAALEAAHWGARTALDARRGYSSYLIDSEWGRVFFAGDTAYTRLFDGVPDVDLAIFGIGAYEPWINAHANPEQVWEMFTSMRAARLLPMHHSTFELGKEPLEEPLRRLREVARDDWHRVVIEELGQSWKGGA